VNCPSTVESSTHRVFFALWPDLQIRSELAKIAVTELRGNGKRVPSNNLHLTLAFVGAVDTKQEELARAAADSVHESAFRLNLERLGFFDNSKVAWSAPGEIDVALSALVNALHGALSERQLAFDSGTFRPHVTLARSISAIGAEIAHSPVSWLVREFCLVRSVTDSRGGHYQPVNFWPLS